jgi:hypothetical protein
MLGTLRGIATPAAAIEFEEPPMNLGLGPIATEAIGAAIVGAVLLGALLLRSACDLCSIEPPPKYLRCLALTLVLALIGAPIGYGAKWAASRLTGELGIAPDNAPFIAVVLALPILAIVCVLLYVPALRVRPMKAASIWVVNTLISSVVSAVLVMLVIGGWATVDSVRRLF